MVGKTISYLKMKKKKLDIKKNMNYFNFTVFNFYFIYINKFFFYKES